MENKENEVLLHINITSDRIDDEVLVKLVKANPILYDKSCKNYKNSEMKKEIWGAIAANCDGVSGMYCIKCLVINIKNKIIHSKLYNGCICE